MIRGLNTKGMADALRERVQQYINQPGGPPPMTQVHGASVATVTMMMQALSYMICIILSHTTSHETVTQLNRAIKLFLTLFHKFDAGLRKHNEKPTWVTSYNFPCLLNLPDAMARFGPLTNLWEGGGQGEKFLQLVKPLWQGYRSGWNVQLLERLLCEKSLNFIRQNTADEPSTTELDDLKAITHNTANEKHYVYKDIAQVKKEFTQRKCMSVVFLSTGLIGCVTYNRAAIMIYPIIIDTVQCCKLGLTYFNVTLNDVEPIATFHHSEVSIQHYCIMLPELSHTGLPNLKEHCGWAIINSKWEAYCDDDTFSFATI
jgi:hypothetical protein